MTKDEKPGRPAPPPMKVTISPKRWTIDIRSIDGETLTLDEIARRLTEGLGKLGFRGSIDVRHA